MNRPIAKLSKTIDFILFLLYEIPHTLVVRDTLYSLASNVYYCYPEMYRLILDLIPYLTDSNIREWYHYSTSQEPDLIPERI